MAARKILNIRQKAFRPVDGCQGNLAILDAVLGNARSLKSKVYMAFVDMKKAFDSVSRESVERGMRRMGVSAPLRRGIMTSFEGARTKIKYRGKNLDKTGMLRGVKQGDPLSPILFNFILDEVISEIECSPIGVPL